MEISAQDFENTWRDFSKKLERETIGGKWTEHWQSDSVWSNFILGGKTSSDKESPIGEFFQQQFGDNLAFRREDGSFDLTFHDSSKLTTFYELNTKWEIQSFQEDHYPRTYLTLIEHENNIHSAWEEIAKLSYERARLKVLITYHSSDNLIEIRRLQELEMIQKTFKEVILQSHGEFPENNSTEYLLIIGRNDQDLLNWSYSIFDYKGEKTHYE